MLVETDRTLTTDATFALQLLEVEAFQRAQVIFIASGPDHGYFIEERVYNLRRILGCASPIGVKLLEFLMGEDETHNTPQSIIREQ